MTKCERVKVVEEGGALATAVLRKTDPFRRLQVMG